MLKQQVEENLPEFLKWICKALLTIKEKLNHLNSECFRCSKETPKD